MKQTLSAQSITFSCSRAGPVGGVEDVVDHRSSLWVQRADHSRLCVGLDRTVSWPQAQRVMQRVSKPAKHQQIHERNLIRRLTAVSSVSQTFHTSSEPWSKPTNNQMKKIILDKVFEIRDVTVWTFLMIILTKTITVISIFKVLLKCAGNV